MHSHSIVIYIRIINDNYEVYVQKLLSASSEADENDGFFGDYSFKNKLFDVEYDYESEDEHYWE